MQLLYCRELTRNTLGSISRQQKTPQDNKYATKRNHSVQPNLSIPAKESKQAQNMLLMYAK